MSKLDGILPQAANAVPVEMGNQQMKPAAPERYVESVVYEDARQAQAVSGIGMQASPNVVSPVGLSGAPAMTNPGISAQVQPVEAHRDPRVVAPAYSSGYVEQRVPTPNYGVNPQQGLGMNAVTPTLNTGMAVNRGSQNLPNPVSNPIAPNPISPFGSSIDNSVDKGLLNSGFNTRELRRDECVGLGFADGQKVVMLNYKTLDVQPLAIPEIRDNQGLLSDKVNQVERALGLSVIPFECLPISDKVVELQRHSISWFNGIKVVSGKDGFISQAKVDEFINACYRHLSEGLVIMPTLTILATISGKQYMLPRFNEHEMQYLLGRLANFRANIVLIGDHQMCLVFEDGNHIDYSQPAYIEELAGSVLNGY